MYRNIQEAIIASDEKRKELEKIYEERLEDINSSEEYEKKIVKLFYSIVKPIRKTVKNFNDIKKNDVVEYNKINSYNRYSNYGNLAVRQKIYIRKYYYQTPSSIFTIQALIKYGEKIADCVTRSKTKKDFILEFTKFLRKHEEVFSKSNDSTSKEYQLAGDILEVDDSYSEVRIEKKKFDKILIDYRTITFVNEEDNTPLGYYLNRLSIDKWATLEPHYFLIKELYKDYREFLINQAKEIKDVFEKMNEQFSHYLVATQI